MPSAKVNFLDEIQEYEEAITALKFWAIDNRYDVIVSGSLLGIDYKPPSFHNALQIFWLFYHIYNIKLEHEVFLQFRS